MFLKSFLCLLQPTGHNFSNTTAKSVTKMPYSNRVYGRTNSVGVTIELSIGVTQRYAAGHVHC